MTTPEGLPDAEEWQHAELMLCLPADWLQDPGSRDELLDERKYWPIRLLKMLARFPHEYGTWLGFGHTIPNGDPPEPYAPGTGMSCALLLPPVTLSERFHRLTLEDGTVVRFWAVVPIYAEELALKLDRGRESLFDGFDEHDVSEVLNPSRPNTAATH